MPSTKDQFTKVFVKRNEHPLFCYRLGEDRVVCRAGRISPYPSNVVAARTEDRKCVPRCILVQKNAHGFTLSHADWVDPLILQPILSISKTCEYIFPRNARIIA